MPLKFQTNSIILVSRKKKIEYNHFIVEIKFYLETKVCSNLEGLGFSPGPQHAFPNVF
jgi:hypothetical protein